MKSREALPRFRGRINTPSGRQGYGFIDKASIDQIGGPQLVLPPVDLLIHINENRELPNPIPKGVWIIFFARRKPEKRTGIEVLGAMLENAETPA